MRPSIERLPDPPLWLSSCASNPDSTLMNARHSRSSTAPATGRLRVRDAHLVGIGGSGMRALAELLVDVGCRVTGSDATLSETDRWQMHLRGLRVCAGHEASHLPDEADVLIYSPAVPVNNAERQAARRIGIPQLSLPQALGWLMQSRRGISVAGTHGKTTTTALLGHLLGEAGKSPSVICGGVIRGRNVSGWAGRGKTLVVESCEYRRHFLELKPQHAILLNIEPDHFDCFGSMEQSIAAFADFAARLPEQGVLVINRDCQAAMEAGRQTKARVITYGRHSEADWRMTDVRPTTFGWSFVVQHRGRHVGRFRLPSPVGEMVPNALAAVAMAAQLGVPRHRLQADLKTFAGVRRRFERVGSYRGIELIDDYAHHPSAIAGVLSAVRTRFAGRRIWCAFQPHQVSRTKALISEFAAQLSAADEVLIPPVFAARERGGNSSIVWARELARLTERRGSRARFVGSLDEITRTIETEARPGDVFLTLGAGDIDSIAHDFSERVKRQQAS